MKQIKFSICTASLCLLMSCVDLDLNPLSEGSSENWYSSQAEIEMSFIIGKTKSTNFQNEKYKK